jgi:hypothetical protein
MATKISDTEIERRFAALDERIAEVDEALAHLRELTAAMNARLLAHEEHTAAEVQTAAAALDDLGERVEGIEAVTALPWIMSEDGTEWRAELPDGGHRAPGRRRRERRRRLVPAEGARERQRFRGRPGVRRRPRRGSVGCQVRGAPGVAPDATRPPRSWATHAAQLVNATRRGWPWATRRLRP